MSYCDIYEGLGQLKDRDLRVTPIAGGPGCSGERAGSTDGSDMARSAWIGGRSELRSPVLRILAVSEREVVREVEGRRPQQGLGDGVGLDDRPVEERPIPMLLCLAVVPIAAVPVILQRWSMMSGLHGHPIYPCTMKNT